MNDEAGILQNIKNVFAFTISLVSAPLCLVAIWVIIGGTLLDLVFFPGYYYGTILLLYFTGLILSYTLGMLTFISFREWRKQQLRTSR